MSTFQELINFLGKLTQTNAHHPHHLRLRCRASSGHKNPLRSFAISYSHHFLFNASHLRGDHECLTSQLVTEITLLVSKSIAMTRRPMAFAICTPICPTPPPSGTGWAKIRDIRNRYCIDARIVRYRYYRFWNRFLLTNHCVIS